MTYIASINRHTGDDYESFEREYSTLTGVHRMARREFRRAGSSGRNVSDSFSEERIREGTAHSGTIGLGIRVRLSDDA